MELRIWVCLYWPESWGFGVDIGGPFPSNLILLGLSIEKKKDFSLYYFCYARKIILHRLIDTKSKRFNDSYAGFQKLLKWTEVKKGPCLFVLS